MVETLIPRRVLSILKILHVLNGAPYITEGKYGHQLDKIRKFRVVLSSGSHETGSKEIKVTASDSDKTGPYIHIFFWGQGHGDV